MDDADDLHQRVTADDPVWPVDDTDDLHQQVTAEDPAYDTQGWVTADDPVDPAYDPRRQVCRGPCVRCWE